jgi:hypothetical protein
VAARRPPPPLGRARGLGVALGRRTLHRHQDRAARVAAATAWTGRPERRFRYGFGGRRNRCAAGVMSALGPCPVCRRGIGLRIVGTREVAASLRLHVGVASTSVVSDGDDPGVVTEAVTCLATIGGSRPPAAQGSVARCSVMGERGSPTQPVCVRAGSSAIARCCPARRGPPVAGLAVHSALLGALSCTHG